MQGMGPALELGRSFVRQEYQGQAAPLALLWRGIGEYLVRNAEFGVPGKMHLRESHGQRVEQPAEPMGDI